MSTKLSHLITLSMLHTKNSQPINLFRSHSVPLTSPLKKYILWRYTKQMSHVICFSASFRLLVNFPILRFSFSTTHLLLLVLATVRLLQKWEKWIFQLQRSTYVYEYQPDFGESFKQIFLKFIKSSATYASEFMGWKWKLNRTEILTRLFLLGFRNQMKLQ